MKVLVVSDTHHSIANYLEVVKKELPLDLVIHCGDVENYEQQIIDAAGCEVQMVRGNNDFFSDLPREKEFQIGNYQAWLTHGHTYYVSMGNETIVQEAQERGVDLVFFGHSHRPVVENRDGVIAVNPGSLTYPRQEGKRPSYVVMELDESKKAKFKINYL